MTLSEALDVMIKGHQIAFIKGIDPIASATYRKAVAVVEASLEGGE